MRFLIILLISKITIQKTFNSLYEIPLRKEYEDDWTELSFNSLYEIPQRRLVLMLRYLTFNSLYEIPPGFLTNHFRQKIFQFSLWDSPKPRVYWQKRSLDFQFSLWDSLLYICSKLACHIQLSILFMRFPHWFWTGNRK